MAEISRSDCIKHLKRSRDILMLSSHVDNQRNEAFNKAISDMEKIEQIEQMLSELPTVNGYIDSAYLWQKWEQLKE